MRYSEIISKMTLEEKASLLSGGGIFRSKTIERLGIPAMHFADGPHGVRRQAGSSDHLGLNASLPATCFPTSAAVANSWDEELVEEMGKYLGAEAASQEVNMLLGPGLNIKRSPLCGRNFEYYSEDPYLSGKMAAASIRGIQSNGISACPKHYAVNNQETLRMHSDSVLDERTLREIYLTNFEIAVKEGKPLGLMTSYNKVNGTYASECPKLLTDILQDEWGFEGIVVTDWGGSNDRVEAARAGGHLEMPTTGGDTDRAVVKAVRDGTLDEACVDKLVDDYLHVLYSTKLDGIAGQARNDGSGFDVEKHHAFAKKVAGESIVLLKNDENILPLKQGTSAAVIGDFAETPRYQGFGSSVVNPTKLDKPFDFIAESGLKATYCKGYERFGASNQELLARAVLEAKNSDVVIMFIGLDEMSETEGCERPHMRINRNQIEVLEAVHKVNANIVAVFVGGSPFETPWIDKCKAVLHVYLGGQAGAGAVADALTGKINPSGKLAETWPMNYDDTPARAYYPGMEKTAEYREGLYVGYRYYSTVGANVRFPFGYGLSYTSFEYSNLIVDEQKVSLNVKNTGSYEGSEVIQIYIGVAGKDRNDRAVFRPKIELKGFKKVHLNPGEEKTITITLDDKAFRYFNAAAGKFEIEGGEYTVYAAASSQDIRLEGNITVKGTDAAVPYNAALLPSYYTGYVKNITNKEFECLLGRPLPPSKWDRKSKLELNDTYVQLSYARGLTGRFVYRLLTRMKVKAENKGKPNLNIMFIYNSPFRGLAKNMAGAVNMEMSEAVLFMFNGHFFRGMGRFIRAFFRFKKAKKDTAKILNNTEK
jgi:beta-glucosidase